MSYDSNGYKYGYKRNYNKKPEARSYDRVHFTIMFTYLLKETIRKCLNETLGLDVWKLKEMAKSGTDLHIICRPSQFARFIILRHVKYGEQNNMACLNMRLVLPEVIHSDPPWDVSDNVNICGSSDSKDVS